MRYQEIDMLRGFSIIAMIAIHATSYFLKSPVASWTWNISQFAVAVFVFCSGYLFFKKSFAQGNDFTLGYLIKRLRRLLVPYYYYLAALLILTFIKNPVIPSLGTLLRQLTLTTPTNEPSWLVLLFLELTVVMLFMAYAWHKNRLLFWLYSLLATASSIFFMFYVPPVNFKFTMWLPWSVVFVAALFFVQNEEKKGWGWGFALFWASVFALATYALQSTGHSLAQYANKYPPNLYHIAYGLACTGLLYELFSMKTFQQKIVDLFLSFLSKHSYSLYFIHFLLIYAFLNFARSIVFNLGWPLYFLALLITAVAAQWVLNFATRRFIPS